jgi:hypothetical protein
MIKKIGVLAGALTVSASVAALAAAMPASAAHQAALRPAKDGRPAGAAISRPGPGSLNQPAQYTYSVPGYGATSTNGFEQVTETTTLNKDVGQFSSSYQPFISVYNDSTSPEVELIPISNGGTPVDSWNPNADIGGVSATGSFWVQPRPYPAGSACAGNADPRGCFYAGETVTLTVYYNTGLNRAYMTAADKNNGDEYSAYYQYTSAQKLTSAHVGDIWLATFPGGGTFTASPRTKELGEFRSVQLTDTSGHQKALADWPHYQRIMTSNGQSTGRVEAEPSPLSGGGDQFSISVR